ncbi:hypothetical protein SOVF_182660 [Spinacia oleracea]|nr:hypothetical protein SOVF_182660 [Spinacia oleracea]
MFTSSVICALIILRSFNLTWCGAVLCSVTSTFFQFKEHLAKSRRVIEHTHGKFVSRARELNNSHSLDMSLYLRLELLEGVAAFHCGKFGKCREALADDSISFWPPIIEFQLKGLVWDINFSTNGKLTYESSPLNLQLSLGNSFMQLVLRL